MGAQAARGVLRLLVYIRLLQGIAGYCRASIRLARASSPQLSPHEPAQARRTSLLTVRRALVRHVISRTSVVGPFFLQDSIPLSRAEVEPYIWLTPMTS